MIFHKQSGITFLELIAALAVLSILLGIGVPSFISVVQNSRISSGYQGLTSATFLARSEAVKRSGYVSICARNTDTSCGDDWTNGWLVFTENFANGALGSIDAGEEILLINGPINEQISIQAIGRPIQAASSSPQSSLQYSNRGSTNWQGGTFVVCDERGPEHAMALNIMLTGDARKARPGADSEIPLDVNGVPVSCP